MIREIAIFLGLGTATVAGCAFGPSKDQLLRRAAFDLQCDKSRIYLREIDSKTIGARGCDQQATYVEVCGDLECTWVLNSARPVNRD